MSDQNYKSICDVCHKKTWYDQEQQCHMTYPKTETCKTCRHTDYDHSRLVRCQGTLRLIDTSDLAPQFAPYLHDYRSRLVVKTSYGEVRGYVGKTTGRKPVYLLLPRSNSTGSSVLLGKSDVITRVIKVCKP